MSVQIDELGAIGFASASQLAAGMPGANSVQVDLPNGPTNSSQVWIVDSASMIYKSSTDAGVSFQCSGLCVVPVGVGQIADQIGFDDFVNRGAQAVNQQTARGRFIVPNVLFSIVLLKKIVIPFGCTLRAVAANDPSNPLNFPRGLLTLSAVIRTLNVCECS